MNDVIDNHLPIHNTIRLSSLHSSGHHQRTKSQYSSITFIISSVSTLTDSLQSVRSSASSICDSYKINTTYRSKCPARFITSPSSALSLANPFCPLALTLLMLMTTSSHMTRPPCLLLSRSIRNLPDHLASQKTALWSFEYCA